MLKAPYHDFDSTKRIQIVKYNSIFPFEPQKTLGIPEGRYMPARVWGPLCQISTKHKKTWQDCKYCSDYFTTFRPDLKFFYIDTDFSEDWKEFEFRKYGLQRALYFSALYAAAGFDLNYEPVMLELSLYWRKMKTTHPRIRRQKFWNYISHPLARKFMEAYANGLIEALGEDPNELRKRAWKRLKDMAIPHDGQGEIMSTDKGKMEALRAFSFVLDPTLHDALQKGAADPVIKIEDSRRKLSIPEGWSPPAIEQLTEAKIIEENVK